MSSKYKIRSEDQLYFITFTVIDWIDVFIRDEYRKILIDSIAYCQKNKGLEVYAYCIMTSHLHLIVRSDGENTLGSILRDLKSFTSRHIRKAIENPSFTGESRRSWMLLKMYNAGKGNSANNDFQFWMQDSHPVELCTNEMLQQRVDYIHLNPVAAGFVDVPEAWVYSSARDYAGTSRGPIELVYLW